MAFGYVRDALSDVGVRIGIVPVGSQAKVTWVFEHPVKYTPIGWTVGQILMSIGTGNNIDANLQGLADRAPGHRYHWKWGVTEDHLPWGGGAEVCFAGHLVVFAAAAIAGKSNTSEFQGRPANASD